MVARPIRQWLIGPVAVALACGCASAPPPKPAPAVAPASYQEALRAYWSERNSTAFVLAALAVEQDPNPRHAAHAAYLVEVLAWEKLSKAQLEEALSDPRIEPLMLDIYVRGVGALKTNDFLLAFEAFRDFVLSTPSERWRAVGLKMTAWRGWRGGSPPGEIDQNLRLAELALQSAPDVTLAGQIAEAVAGPVSRAQKVRAAQIMAVVFERTGELSWAEKAFARLLETQQFDAAEALAPRILTNSAATVSTYVSVGSNYAGAGQLQRAEEILTEAAGRFGDRYAELTVARAELYRLQQRYDDALNELLRAGREVAQFRRERHHPVWARQIKAVALAGGPDDSVYAITGESRPKVLHLNRDGDVVAEYGPFEDPTDDGTHPFAVFKDGTFLIRNRRWSPEGRLLQELPLSSDVSAVSVTADQRLIAVGPTDGIKLFGANGELLAHLCRDGVPSPECYYCPCSAIAASKDRIFLVTGDSLVHLNKDGHHFSRWEGAWVRSVAAGREGVVYVSGTDQVKIFSTRPLVGWRSFEVIPLGGGVIAAATSGGFYVAGVATESGVWLVKYAPPAAPRE